MLVLFRESGISYSKFFFIRLLLRVPPPIDFRVPRPDITDAHFLIEGTKIYISKMVNFLSLLIIFIVFFLVIGHIFSSFPFDVLFGFQGEKHDGNPNRGRKSI